MGSLTTKRKHVVPTPTAVRLAKEEPLKSVLNSWWSLCLMNIGKLRMVSNVQVLCLTRRHESTFIPRYLNRYVCSNFTLNTIMSCVLHEEMSRKCNLKDEPLFDKSKMVVLSIDFSSSWDSKNIFIIYQRCHSKFQIQSILVLKPPQNIFSCLLWPDKQYC